VSKSTIARIGTTAPLSTGILNWDCWEDETDVKQLARNVRAVSELTNLAHKGLVTKLRHSSLDDAEAQIVDDLLEMSALGAFVLARKLGALDGA